MSSTNSCSITILGSNSHLATGLIHNFLNRTETGLLLFTLNPKRLKAFLSDHHKDQISRVAIISSYDEFSSYPHQVIINCIGAGAPNALGPEYYKWFTIKDKYDNLVLNYLSRNTKTAYINFSSGAVYGIHEGPVNEKSTLIIPVNDLKKQHLYTIANLHAEAKHRSLAWLRITDIRIFSYFSRFADLGSGYFMTDAARATISGKEFSTSNDNMLRDYIHPSDIFNLVKIICNCENNSSVDAFTRAPISKKEILILLSSEFGLKYKTSCASRASETPNGENSVYYSARRNPSSYKWKPMFSSSESIREEMTHLVKMKTTSSIQQ
ncbi:MAG: NAD-dependent epimerase/dehydratase family protein [Syntrophaceae bacterium]|nr:NAD-dependent epimerase/dehydratase family protein [Syntrophaceae bacterium]